MNTEKHIYLDNNATTRVAPVVFEAMRPFLTDVYGNPSSAHTLGKRMRAAIERARDQVGELLGASESSEIVFTSCGSESDNWAIRGVLEQHPDKRHIVTTRVEHEAIRNLCERLESNGYEVTWLEVDEQGLLNLDDIRAALRLDTAVVSIMLANNETGVLFPMDEIGRIVRENSNAVFHVDAVQAAGKIPIDVSKTAVDLLAISGHKLHAPAGIGALYVRRGVEVAPMIIGGKQEDGRRAGTSAVPYIVALGKACELANDPTAHERIKRLRDHFEDTVLDSIPKTRLNGTRDRALRLPNTSNISFEHIEGESILAHLDELGIYVSTGSACNSGAHVSSPTLRAMNVPYSAAQGSIRFSLGRYNTEEEIAYVLYVLPGIISRLTEMSPYEFKNPRA
jgi:cysteine desulfurase